MQSFVVTVTSEILLIWKMFLNWMKNGDTSCPQWVLFPWRCADAPICLGEKETQHFPSDRFSAEPMPKASCWLTKEKHCFSFLSLQDKILQHGKLPLSAPGASPQQLLDAAEGLCGEKLIWWKFSSAKCVQLAGELLVHSSTLPWRPLKQALNKKCLPFRKRSYSKKHSSGLTFQGNMQE